MWKKRRLRMESLPLPHDVLELIMERLPVESLLRFKAVSKQWILTIESPFFRERHLKQRQQSGDPDVLMVSGLSETGIEETARTLALGSSSSVKIPAPWDKSYLVCQSICDGLICLYNNTHHHAEPGFVFNPTTRWHRILPLCELQLLIINLGYSYYKLRHGLFKFGFGKDKFTGTYKPVYLYNSSEIGREDATTCEVFDFNTDSWRYVTPSAPYRILAYPNPAYVDGSLHWFTECQETKVVSFDLHTEAFQVLSKAPFANAPVNEIVMCNLNNRLCVSLKKCSNQVIWSFNSGNKTWDKLCSLDLDLISLRFDIPTLVCALRPLSLLDGEKKKKKKLLFYDCVSHRALMTYDLETKSYDTAFSANHIGYSLCYFPSLFSVS